MKKKGNIFKPLTIVFAVLLAICIIAIPITNQFASVINVALKAQTQKIVAEEGATIYFASSYPDEAELVAHEAELCRQIEGEGAALLVNKDGALPLAKGTKFTTFSQSSYNLLYGGTGSGSMSADDAVTLKSALETVFGEGTVNTEQWKFYVTCGYKRVNAATTGGNQAQYTEFEYSDFEVDEKDDHFVVEVDVKNVGDVDGKHTVQIYFQSPYTEYDKANLVEKAAVEICGFDKKMIRAGHTEHFKIEIKKEDLTSYDVNNAKTYILEDGDYYFTIGKNAHDAINNILAAKGASVDGDASLADKGTNDTFDKTTYAVSAKTGKAITNLFDNADLNKYSGNGGQTVTYLSRQDWIGTYPTTQVLAITDTMWADGLTHDESGHIAIVEKMKALYYPNATMPAVGVAGTVKAGDMATADYDDPRWTELISQLPYTEAITLIYNGFHFTEAAPTIGLPGTLDENGPQGFTASLMGGASAMAYTSEDVMAATYNRELIHDMGSCIGEDFLHATPTGADKVYAGLYGPGANIHRTPYLLFLAGVFKGGLPWQTVMEIGYTAVCSANCSIGSHSVKNLKRNSARITAPITQRTMRILHITLSEIISGFPARTISSVAYPR